MNTLILALALLANPTDYYQPVDDSPAITDYYETQLPVPKAVYDSESGSISILLITSKNCPPCRLEPAEIERLKANGWTSKQISEGGSANIFIVDVDSDARHVRKYGQADESGAYPVPQWVLVQDDKPIRNEIGFKTWKQIAEFFNEGRNLIPGVAAAHAAQSPTPHAEVRRVLALLRPQSNETFVDYGCGDGRWLIEAARTYGCRAVGIEIDPAQAEIARRVIAANGLTDRIRIVEGDATSVAVEAQVGVAYLYPDTLIQLKPKLLKLNRFATYLHQVDGVQMTQNGDAWVWQKPVPVQQSYVQPRPYAMYGGQAYSGRVCNSPYCSMCNAIARQLGQ